MKKKILIVLLAVSFIGNAYLIAIQYMDAKEKSVRSSNSLTLYFTSLNSFKNSLEALINGDGSASELEAYQNTIQIIALQIDYFSSGRMNELADQINELTDKLEQLVHPNKEWKKEELQKIHDLLEHLIIEENRLLQGETSSKEYDKKLNLILTESNEQIHAILAL